MPIIKNMETIGDQEVAILIEVEQAPEPESIYGDLRGDGAEQVISAVRDVFGDGMELARSCAIRVVDSVAKMEERVRPNEFELQIGIELNSEVGAILAKASAGAQLQVTMKWKLKEDKE